MNPDELVNTVPAWATNADLRAAKGERTLTVTKAFEQRFQAESKRVIEELRAAFPNASEDFLAANSEPPVQVPARSRTEALAGRTIRQNKYGAQRTWSEMCQRWFDSKGEARHGEELWLRQKAGEIKHLQFQVPFVLAETPRIKATLDFAYLERGQAIYEDFKGVLTRDSRTRYAWLKEKFGIEVRLIRK